MGVFMRAHHLLNLKDYECDADPVYVCALNADCLPQVDRQYILRMLIKKPNEGLIIPPELGWLVTPLLKCWDLQYKWGLNPVKDFIYITVRHGIVTSENDDVWHVDGFSMRLPHRPEQNYIYSSNDPTEILYQRFKIPDSFDPYEAQYPSIFSRQRRRI